MFSNQSPFGSEKRRPNTGNGNHFVGDAGRNFWAMSDLQVSTACVLLVRCLKPSLVTTGDEAGPLQWCHTVWPLWQILQTPKPNFVVGYFEVSIV